jgi:hypothetical protein
MGRLVGQRAQRVAVGAELPGGLAELEQQRGLDQPLLRARDPEQVPQPVGRERDRDLRQPVGRDGAVAVGVEPLEPAGQCRGAGERRLLQLAEQGRDVVPGAP